MIRSLRGRRTCTNCGAVEWPRFRWCEDCLNAGAKTLAGELIAAAVLYVLHFSWAWLRLHL